MTAATSSYGLAARRWVAAQLAAVPALAGVPVREHPAAVGTGWPVITVDVASPFLATTDVSGHALFATGQVRVRVAVGTSSFEDVTGLYDALVAAVGDVTNSPVPGGAVVLTARFRSGFEQAEHVDDTEVRTLGCIVEVRLQTA